MCYVEAAYELRNSVDFMVASQIAVPLAGWPYESILRRIEAGTTGESLGKLIVDSYVGRSNTAGRDQVTMTLLDLRTLRDSWAKTSTN